MNFNTYTYSLLQYRHSQILEEVLNVGVIVYHQQEQKLFFIYPERLARLRFAYPDVQEKTIRLFCRTFENRANEITKNPEIFASYDLNRSFEKFLNDEFISEDSSTLQFSIPRTCINESLSFEIVNNQLYNLYFTVFEHHGEIVKRFDEMFLINRYKNLLKNLDKEILNRTNQKLYFDYIIRPSEENEIKFELAWENNGLNLVKPVSFDVQRKETLQRKAYLNYGQFSAIEDYAEKNTLRFDLLLAKPKNKELFKSYDEAVKLLEKPRFVNLIDSDELEKYSFDTFNALSY